MRFAITFLVALLGVSLANANIILKPTKTGGVEAGYIFVQGASIPAKNYNKYARQLQDKFNGSLWVVLTEFVLDTPEPLQIGSVMSSAFDSLKSAGFKYNQQTPFFFGGHSLGGIMVQNYVFGSASGFPFTMRGLILEGSFISRSNIDKLRKSSWSVLTLGAELDGLARLTRIAESYHMLNMPNSLVLALPGMNHYQFSGEGNPPSNVVKNDIKPEVTNEQARDAITDATAAFMHTILGSAESMQSLQKYKTFTNDILQPLVDALNQEGFYHFIPPCSQNSNLRPPNCLLSSPWTTAVSQLAMSSLTQADIVVEDSLRSVVGVPEHFPSINNKCGPGAACVLNISTITENVYNFIDGFDVGLEPIAAAELRTKMESRQSLLQAFTGKKFNFNDTDNGNRCGEINQLSLKYALTNTPKDTLTRYLSKGVQLKIGNDVGPVNNGFLWIMNSLVKIILMNLNEYFSI
jgi:hypothetical protein